MARSDIPLEECIRRAEAASTVHTSDVEKFRQAALDYIEYSVEAVNLELMQMVLRMWDKLYKRTPKDTGYARNNWHVTGRPSSWVPPNSWKSHRREYEISDVEERERKSIRSIKRSKTGLYYINNNTSYIMMLEAGYSTQGSGFIHRTYTEEIEALQRRLARIR